MRVWHGKTRTLLLLLIPFAFVPLVFTQEESHYQPPANGEFYFLRLEYKDRAMMRRNWGRGWWRQDWPEADEHFTEGIHRLTRIDIGAGRHTPLTDDRIYDYPWIYATQAAYWDLSDSEIARLRDYLARGGFLIVDDFYGDQEWEVFRETMARTLPGRPIVEIENDDPMKHVLYDLGDAQFIPGLRHLGRGPGGGFRGMQPQSTSPHWRAIYDEKGRMAVGINYNMDVGDAWEHADLPEYPAEMTILAYRLGINYIIYSMTH